MKKLGEFLTDTSNPVLSEQDLLNIDNTKCGGDGEKDTPVTMPNTEVKLLSADCSEGLPLESRTPPRKRKQLNESSAVFCLLFEIAKVIVSILAKKYMVLKKFFQGHVLLFKST